MSARSIVAGLALLASAAALPTVAVAQNVAYAAGGTTNCRAGPGTGYHVVTKVYGGTPVQILGSQGGWYSVSANGRQCWMAGSRLAFGQGRAPVVLAPQPYYAPQYAYQPYPYFYGGPSFSFGFGTFGDFDRDRHRRRGNRDWDWNDGHGGDWDWRDNDS
jgi:uncharacterized protein YraI